MNVLDLPGPQFLKFYLLALVTAVVAAWWMRRMLRTPGDDLPPGAVDPGPYEIAYLSGGPSSATDAAAASLVHQGVVRANATSQRLSALGEPPAHLPPIEAVVYRTISTTDSGANIRKIRAAVRGTAATRRIEESLRAVRLILDDMQRATICLIAPVPILIVLLIGIAKIAVGISRGKPIGLLVLLCLTTFVILIIFLSRLPLRTQRGDRLLKTLRQRHSALQLSARHPSAALGSADVAMAMGLFGMAVLVSDPLDELRRTLRRQTSWGGGCGSGGCGSGGCGGGGCGGCGGD